MGKKEEVANPESLIFEYMKIQNRPYSANDVFLNLQKKVGKTQVIKLLEEMGSNGKLVEKIYGKVSCNYQFCESTGSSTCFCFK